MTSLDEMLGALRRAMEAGLPKRAAEIRAAVASLGEDEGAARATLQRLAHRLRGTAGTYGHESLGALAAEVEGACRDGAPRAELFALGASLAAACDADAPPLERPTSSRPPPVARAQLAGRRVLAIDDDADTRTLLELTLVRLGGADAEVADDPVRALARLEAGPVDLVVVDAMMPAMNGLEFAREARRRRPDVAIAFLSASTPEELGWQLPPRSAWLRKPFRPAELLDALSPVLAG